MRVSSLSLREFRSYESALAQFDDGINVKLVATGGRALRDDWKILEDAHA